jgi:hypothetical protein
MIVIYCAGGSQSQPGAATNDRQTIRLGLAQGLPPAPRFLGEIMVLLRRIDFLQEIFFQIELLAWRRLSRNNLITPWPKDRISAIRNTNHQVGTVGATDRPTTPTG